MFEDDIERCMKAGVNGHIAKPVDPDTLFCTRSPALTNAPGGAAANRRGNGLYIYKSKRDSTERLL